MTDVPGAPAHAPVGSDNPPVPAPVPVDVPGTPYEVHVGPGVRHQLGDLVSRTTRAERVMVVTQPPIADHWGDGVVAVLEGSGLDVAVVPVPDGEQAKSPAVLGDLWERCASLGLQRRDAVVALGGGVVGDLAGFVAATWNRGIPIVQVPTTLLAMVDSSIGGKTGIDLASGKNLVGAIHQPAVVVADTDVLATLPDRVLREGFGEVVKHALIADPALFARLEADGATTVQDVEGRPDLVRRNIAIKASVVAADTHEHGIRAHLNLGHTYAHALEALTGYTSWWHGEAVAVGTLVALALGEELGRHGPELRERTAAVLTGLGLPTVAPRFDPEAVLGLMARDKKVDGGLRYVVLDDLGVPVVVRPTADQVLAAVAYVATAEPDVQPHPTPATDDAGKTP